MEEIEVRLLGYYNGPEQKMSAEVEEPERAAELAVQMAATFDAIDDPNHDPDFADAIQSGVFIMRDREANLYAYFPKERLARVHGVMYNRESIIQLPLEYKTWFKPGETLTILPKGSVVNNVSYQNNTFFDYLRYTEQVGKQVALVTDYLPSKGFITGEITVVGRDFLSITDTSGQNYVISNHMCVQTNLPILQKRKAEVSLLQFEVGSMGYIKSYDQKLTLGWVVTNEGESLSFKGTSLLDPKLREGSQVVFTRYPDEGFVTNYKGQQLAYANYIHSPGTDADLMRLAQQLHRQKKPNEAREVLRHILNEYPDHIEANAMLQELPAVAVVSSVQPSADSVTAQFNRANEIISSGGNKEEALEIYQSLLAEGKKVKDCVTRIVNTYQALYNEANDDEEKRLRSDMLHKFADENFDKMPPSFWATSYLKVRDDEKFNAFVDKKLAQLDENTDNALRSKLLYFKALYLSQSETVDDQSQVSELAEDSLFLTPFNNKAELLWQPAAAYVGDTPSAPTGRSAYAQALLRRHTASDDDTKWMERLNHARKYAAPTDENGIPLQVKGSDGIYAEILLKAAVSGHAVGSDNRDVTESLLAEYLSYKAIEMVKAQNIESAIYIWGELFATVPGMGYFVQCNLNAMLSAVLGKGIVTADAGVYAPWEEVLDEAHDITPTQWDQIIYAVAGSTDVMQSLWQHIAANAQLTSEWNTYVDITGKEGTLQEVAASIIRKEYQEAAAARLGELHKNIPELVDKLKALSAADFTDIPFTGLGMRDQGWLARLTEECRPLANQYLLTDEAKERLRLGNEIKAKLISMADEVMQQPTMVGVTGLLPLASSISSNIDRVAETIVANIKPKLSLALDSEYIAKGADGYYRIEGHIANDADAGDAEDVSLTISRSGGKIVEIKQPTVKKGKLTAGTTDRFYFAVKLSPGSEKLDAIGFSITCCYTFRDEQGKAVFNPLQCRLGTPRVFHMIETQPYVYGTALDVDDPTFKGRQKEIQYLTDFVMHPNRPSQQIIVYGQKRCGKSTLAEAVRSNLEKNYADKAFCVSFTLTHDTSMKRTYTEADFFYTILKEIEWAVLASPDAEKPSTDFPDEEEMLASDVPARLFDTAIARFKASMAETPGWQQRRLVVIIDEFTNLYNDIRSGWTSPTVLHNWKSIQETNSPSNFATIFIGHDIAPKFLNEVSLNTNATAIIERYPVGYLDEESACQLIVDPIRDVDGRSRFDDAAVRRILYYTNYNPSYIQRFMKKMVDYINANKRIIVTVQDVEKVAQGFITRQYTDFTSIDNFDEFLNNGLLSIYSDIKDSQNEVVLRIIARLTQSTEFCQLDKVKDEVIKLEMNDHNRFIMEHLDEILADLDVRHVIYRQNNNQEIKIIVGLFKEWLIRN